MLRSPLNFAIKVILFSGVVCTLIAGWLWFSIGSFLKTAVLTTGTVVSVYEEDSFDGTSYGMDFSFVVPSGKKMVGSTHIGGDDAGYAKGKSVEVYYNPLNPADVKINSFFQLYLMPIVFSVAAFAEFFSATILTFLSRKRKSDKDWLRQQGHMVHAEVISVDAVSVDDKNSNVYTVTCRWLNPENQQVMTFSSEPFSSLAPTVLGTKLPVYIDPQAPAEKYWIDLSQVISQNLES